MFRIEATAQGGQLNLKLAGDLNIYAASKARTDLARLMAGAPVVELDLGGVEDLDTAGVQLLVWLKRTAAAEGSTLALVRHSPAVMEVLDLLQVTAALGDPILIPPTAPGGARHEV